MDKYSPISLDYFLNMELSPGGGGKEIIKQNNTLKTVRDVVNFYSISSNLEFSEKQITPQNGQYFNCMVAEFRHNTGDHHKIGWKNMTMDYYNSLSPMSDNEIEISLQNNPVEFDNGFIRHSYHRACAMIGRLISGKSYIPFYMEEQYMYDNFKSDDGRQRILPLISRINGLDKVNIPAGDFTITQSGILSLMGIRQNDDVDIIISSNARYQLFGGNRNFIRLDNVEIFEPNKSKFNLFGAHGDDDLINNYSFQIGGYNFLEPRFYFSRKNKKTERDLKDWEGIRRFFDEKSHLGYPFSNLNEIQWGVQYI